MKGTNTLMSRLLMAAILMLTTIVAKAEIAIVVHKDNPMSQVSEDEVTRIFLGKQKAFSSGEKAIPLDLEKGLPPRDEFYEKVVQKTESQLKAYWSRLIFTGKGQPPKAVLDSWEAVSLVSSNPNMIAYVDPSAVDDTVKVVLTIP